MIFLSNDVTKYPQAILDSSTRLINLEAYTGADMLISPLSSPTLTNLLPMTLPIKLGFEKHLKCGVLVQVKIGSDILNSIPNLDSILLRMKEQSAQPWLFVIANIHEDRDGQCIIDGRATNWTMNAYRGAISMWQKRGGLYWREENEKGFVSWVNVQLNECRKIKEEQIHFVKKPVAQLLVGSNSALSTLTSFDNIGIEKAQCILDHCGTLADSLAWLSDMESKGVSGVGEKTLKLAHTRFGLYDDTVLQVMPKLEPDEMYQVVKITKETSKSE